MPPLADSALELENAVRTLAPLEGEHAPAGVPDFATVTDEIAAALEREQGAPLPLICVAYPDGRTEMLDEPDAGCAPLVRVEGLPLARD